MERCSAASAAAGETLPGKAPTARHWVLLEHPLPWPARAEEAAPPEVLRQVRALGSARLGLVRRRRSRSSSGRVITVDTAAAEPRDPMLLVCVHAGRDGCCGRLGNPVAAALQARFPDLTWETSHVGGHRLAANLVCLPHGYVFSRLTPAAALAAAEAYLDGRLLLDHCRGRAGLEPGAQAAELEVRRRTGFDRIGPIGVERVADGTYRVRLPDGSAHTARVAENIVSPSELTSCSGERGPLVNYEPGP